MDRQKGMRYSYTQSEEGKKRDRKKAEGEREEDGGLEEGRSKNDTKDTGLFGSKDGRSIKRSRCRHL